MPLPPDYLDAIAGAHSVVSVRPLDRAGMDADARPKALIRIATQAARDMAPCGREFGMSPSDEGRALRLTCGVSRASSATCSASVAPSFPAHSCD